MTSADLLASDFATLPDLVRAHAGERPDAVAAADPVRRLSWSELDRMVDRIAARLQQDGFAKRSEEHTSELQSLMRSSYAVFCLKKKKQRHALRSTTPTSPMNPYHKHPI